MQNQTKIIKIIGFLVGSIVFYFTVQSYGGFVELYHNLKPIKFWFLLVIANSFLWMLTYTQAWLWMFEGSAKKPGFFSLLRIKLSGEGVNFMTPLGFMAGDPVRLLLLRKYTGPEARLRSIVIDRTMHTLAANLFNLFGLTVLFFLDVGFPLWMHVILYAVYVVLTSVFLIMIVTMVTGRGFGIFEKLFKALKFEKRFPKVHATLDELRTDLEYFALRPKGVFFRCFGLHLGGRFLGAVEIMVILYALQGHVDLLFSVVLVALSSFVSIAGGVIPGAFGILETVYARFSILFGFDPQIGVSIQIVRRLRVLFWVAMGILVLDYQEVGGFLKSLKQNKKAGKSTNSEEQK